MSSSESGKHVSVDDSLLRKNSTTSIKATHVPSNYFARRKTGLSNDRLEKPANDDDIATSIAPGSLPEHFRYDKYLKEKWDKAAEAGTTFRETGISFKACFSPRNLEVVGLGAAIKYQNTLASIFNPFEIVSQIRQAIYPPVRNILSGFEGTIRPGEMLLVLGRPGSGCTTLLKTLANEHAEFYAVNGEVSYDGISTSDMEKHYRGDIGYSPENDIHFPQITVRQTLAVSAGARAPRNHVKGESPQEYVKDVIGTLGAVFGLTHTFDTLVGDENIRGVSGGEKKRVSIAEMLSMRVRLACWDNSTRGLDASTALEFIQALRMATDITRMTNIVSIYQVSDNIYRLFDKVAVLYEGRLAYIGPANQARDYFINMGYEPANRQTTADFLVSVTDPSFRLVNRNAVGPLPRTPMEFADYFSGSHAGKHNSEEVQKHLTDIQNDKHNSMYQASSVAEHSKYLPKGSPYTISLGRQLRILMKRRIQVLQGDFANQIAYLMLYIVSGVTIGSIFLNTNNSTSTLLSRGGIFCFTILLNAFASMIEIPTLYQQRPIVSRHQKAALYHPFIDALALTLVDMPMSFIVLLIFDIIIYYMSGLQRHTSNFFTFVLLLYLGSNVMKAFYRATAAFLPNVNQALAVNTIVAMILAMYMGFIIPKPSMTGAFKWLTYINPLTYTFDGLIANEFYGLHANCSTLIPSGPGYGNVSSANQVCPTLGAEPGSTLVDGERFMALNYDDHHSYLWRNLGLMFVFWVGCLVAYFYIAEMRGSKPAKTSQMVFNRVTKLSKGSEDVESASKSSPADWVEQSVQGSLSTMDFKSALPPARGTFSWHHLNYDVQLSNGTFRRVLDDVSGYVVPGKLTALMGESGAGKTMLLNALAQRLNSGVNSGNRFINGHRLPIDFEVQVGYCQQLDIHLETSTVREALQFSAALRQPALVPKTAKYNYVEDVIKMCGMGSYADAIIGSVGEGLNAQQRKRLTIGVELVAKPQILLVLDEPTSGLSSQDAWAIIQMLKSLTEAGQTILCTIHQPSAGLFQTFDSLLLLRKGGQTCYFGDLGINATEVIAYFEHNGARKCEALENPAEYMLDVIGAGATACTDINWYEIWKQSPHRLKMEAKLNDIVEKRSEILHLEVQQRASEYAATIGLQLQELLRRTFTNYYRNPVYLTSKLIVDVFLGLFIGFSFFKSSLTIQGLHNGMFAFFVALFVGIVHSNLLQIPFLRFRQIYETRERASKVYHWFPMLTATVLVEIPFNIIGSSTLFLCCYWTVGWPSDNGNRLGYQASFAYLILCVLNPLHYTTMSQAVAAMSPNAEIAAILFTTSYNIALIFSGVLQPFLQLTHFWHWMYYLSPVTYIIESLMVNAYAGRPLTCSSHELVTIIPPNGTTCQDYMGAFMYSNGGYLLDGAATSFCQYCPIDVADVFLAQLNMYFDHRWRNVGLLLGYIILNVTLIFGVTYIFRIRSRNPLWYLKQRIGRLAQ